MTFSYLLIMELPKDTHIAVGRLGTILFEKGKYIYVGSAPSEKRLERHIRTEKKRFWHIDYFLEKAEIRKIYITEEKECDIARSIDLPFIKGFGCSDCRCPSHLFYGDLPESTDTQYTQYYP
jgi:Uri superfamily endonuclease